MEAALLQAVFVSSNKDKEASTVYKAHGQHEDCCIKLQPLTLFESCLGSKNLTVSKVFQQ